MSLAEPLREGPTRGTWRPTAAHLRAIVLAVGCFAIAAIWRRADVAIIGVPFAGLAAWGAAHRPRRPVAARLDVEARTLFEGQFTPARVTLVATGDDGGPIEADIVAAALAADLWLAPDPASAARAAAVVDGRAEVVVPLHALRWGRHEVNVDAVAATSSVGAYRTVALGTTPVRITTMPQSAEFDVADTMPRPGGLVGLHQSRRHGSGSEPAEVRPFRPGDRLRRINWAVSSRTGELHVTATWADRDAHVLLLLDTEYDVGVSDGIGGRASSLDVAVRAAAALGEHYLRTGDRVALVDLGRRVRDVPPGSGRRHLRRLLEVLVSAEPGVDHHADVVRVRPITGGALVVALTPLIGRTGTSHVAHLAQHGHAVVVVDTLPEGGAAPSGGEPSESSSERTRRRGEPSESSSERTRRRGEPSESSSERTRRRGEPSESSSERTRRRGEPSESSSERTMWPGRRSAADAWALALADRLRTMERAAGIDRLGELGVPVVAWRGRGTLDEVLRGVSRLSTAPRAGGRR